PPRLQGQREEARDNCAPTSRATTATRPDLSAVTVDDVVVSDLVTYSDCSAGDDVSDPVDRSHVAGRITGGVDVSFGRSHQYNASALQVVAMMRQFTRE